tara:strand:- start:15282 stop:16790 length:1509 start_codon:yes stop_codon:yes gene_type:complete
MAITGGDSLNITPAPQQVALSTNYLDFTNSTNDWRQQYLPDLMEKEAEVFGPRTISGFLSQVGAEEAMTSDQVVWSEQGRLHLSYTAQVASGGGVNVNSVGAASQVTLTKNIDGLAIGTGAAVADHGVRVNDTIIVADATNGVKKCLVIAVADNVLDVQPYTADNLATQGTPNATTVLVYGSEYGKGVSYFSNATASTSGNASDSRTANEPSIQTFTNKPIILKDYYEVSGSDTSRIGWVEISTEEGQGGYMWYLKAESDTRARFNDYLEMAMLEAVKDGTSHADESFIAGSSPIGSQGLFDAIEDRGNVTSGITGVNAATDLAEFDAILAEFDSQGAIEENMMFVNRATSLAMDDMLASMNSYGAGGTSYGVFDNSEDMALNLGFSGFRRGSYDFYKSDMRYLNDKATRGGINTAAGANAIRGVMVPAGTSSVYDQQLGKNLKRPFLHVRYRASATDNRKMKTWTTGSVGAATSALDAMQLHFLSERCLVTQGANNFMLMK